MKLDFSEPGVAISVLAHGAVLALLILNIPWLADKLPVDEAPEAVPIETISQTDFNQIMKGEKSSKDVTKEPATKADKVAETEEQHPEPAKPDVEKEVPLPPPPKPAPAPDPAPPVPTPPPAPPPPPPPPVPEPPQRPDPTPPPPAPPLPPVPTPPVPTPPVPTPPVPPPPVPTPPLPTPPEPPQRDPDAEVTRPAPPPPPKPVPKPPDVPRRAETKPPPKPLPPSVPKPPEVARPVDTKAPPPKPRPVEKPQPDAMARLLDRTETDPAPTPQHLVHKPARPKAASAPPHVAAAEGTAEPTDQRAFDPTDISKILNTAAGAPPSTGRQLSRTASRGAASGTAPKMSPTQSDALDGLLADQFKQCWSYLGLDHGRYIPEIKVSYAEDGSLLSEPTLLNRPSDPAARSLAESALRAVRQCNPLHIPAQFSPFYDQWRSRILRFDPAEMSG